MFTPFRKFTHFGINASFFGAINTIIPTPFTYVPSSLPTDLMSSYTESLTAISTGYVDNGTYFTILKGSAVGGSIDLNAVMPEANTVYTLEFQMRSAVAYADMKTYSDVDTSGYQTEYHYNTVPDVWETRYITFDSKANDKSARFWFLSTGSASGYVGNIDIDKTIKIYKGGLDLSINEGVSDFGSVSGVQLSKEGAWTIAGTHMIPFDVYGFTALSTAQSTIAEYIALGFTGVINNNGRRADSDPLSLKSFYDGGFTSLSIDISTIVAGGSATVTAWKSEMIALKASQPVMWNYVARFHFDNELYSHDSVLLEAFAACRVIDSNIPIHVLCTEDTTDLYDGLVDAYSIYINDDNPWANATTANDEADWFEYSRPYKLNTTGIQENRTVNVTTAQFHQGIRANIGAVSIASIGIGAGALCYFADGNDLTNANGAIRDLDMANHEIWTQMPTIRSYLNEIATRGIVQYGANSQFKFVDGLSDAKTTIVGRTGTDDKCYIFVANHSDPDSTVVASKTFTNTYSGLHYTPSSLVDVVTGLTVGTIDDVGKTVSITLGNNEYAVLEVIKE